MHQLTEPAATHPGAVVIGGGLGGLSAAYALTQAGVHPLVVEERGKPGGLVAGITIEDVSFDIGAESYMASATRVSDLVRTLGLEVIEPTGSSWVYSHSRGALAMPHGMLGIPASLDDPAVAAALTPTELERARADLTLGPEVGADAGDLASFVRARYGEGLLRALVTPIAGGIHSADVADLALDTVCRGLRGALAECGSATAAVAHLRGATPGKPAVVAPRGGMFRLVHALSAHIEDGGGHLSTRTRALGIRRKGECWQVTLSRTEPNPNPALAPTPVGEPWVVTTPRLVVALPLAAGLDLLGGIDGLAVDGWTPTPGGPIAHVTLVTRTRALDEAPRGSGMLVAAPSATEVATGAVRAKALTHYSHKWGWMRTDHPDIHVLRVSYGRAGEEPLAVTPEVGRLDAERLLGIELPATDVVAGLVIRWDGALPPLGPDHWQRVAALKAQVAADFPGLALAGSWVAGSGIGAVIPQGLDAGARLASEVSA